MPIGNATLYNPNQYQTLYSKQIATEQAAASQPNPQTIQDHEGLIAYTNLALAQLNFLTGFKVGGPDESEISPLYQQALSGLQETKTQLNTASPTDANNIKFFTDLMHYGGIIQFAPYSLGPNNAQSLNMAAQNLVQSYANEYGFTINTNLSGQQLLDDVKALAANDLGIDENARAAIEAFPDLPSWANPS